MTRLGILAAILIGQATPDSGLTGQLSDWLKIISPVGALVWYLHYTQKVAFPDASKRHEEAMQKQQDTFLQTMRDQQTEFTETLNRVVDRFDKALQSEREARAAELQAFRETFQGKQL